MSSPSSPVQPEKWVFFLSLTPRGLKSGDPVSGQQTRGKASDPGWTQGATPTALSSCRAGTAAGPTELRPTRHLSGCWEETLKGQSAS